MLVGAIRSYDSDEAMPAFYQGNIMLLLVDQLILFFDYAWQSSSIIFLNLTLFPSIMLMLPYRNRKGYFSFLISFHLSAPNS